MLKDMEMFSFKWMKEEKFWNLKLIIQVNKIMISEHKSDDNLIWIMEYNSFIVIKLDLNYIGTHVLVHGFTKLLLMQPPLFMHLV